MVRRVMGRRKEVKPFELGSKETSMFSNRNWQAAACWTRGGGGGGNGREKKETQSGGEKNVALSRGRRQKGKGKKKERGAVEIVKGVVKEKIITVCWLLMGVVLVLEEYCCQIPGPTKINK